jgi:hypothetical protein
LHFSFPRRDGTFAAMLRLLPFVLCACCLFNIGHAQLSQVYEAPMAKVERLSPDSAERKMMLRVQIILDRSLFRPGKLDGLGGEFTQKAADRFYRTYRIPPGTLLDLATVPEPYTTYTVTDADMKWVGRTSANPPEMARLDSLPYATVHELVAERFHTELTFIEELNPDFAKAGPGTVFRVPSVNPFKIDDVKALERKITEEKRLAKLAAAEAAAAAAAEAALASGTATSSVTQSLTPTGTSPASPTPSAPAKPQRSPDAVAALPAPRLPNYKAVILRKDHIVELYEDDILIACFPCTPGSSRVPVPVGKWKFTSNILFPYFRYDKSVLRDGTPSDEFYNIPPGPNNQVGIVWMGLNRRSVGMHGTMTPDAIGRNESSGCIRLANWDAWEMCQRIRIGTPVIVE